MREIDKAREREEKKEAGMRKGGKGKGKRVAIL